MLVAADLITAGVLGLWEVVPQDLELVKGPLIWECIQHILKVYGVLCLVMRNAKLRCIVQKPPS